MTREATKHVLRTICSLSLTAPISCTAIIRPEAATQWAERLINLYADETLGQDGEGVVGVWETCVCVRGKSIRLPETERPVRRVTGEKSLAGSEMDVAELLTAVALLLRG